MLCVFCDSLQRLPAGIANADAGPAQLSWPLRTALCALPLALAVQLRARRSATQLPTAAVFHVQPELELSRRADGELRAPAQGRDASGTRRTPARVVVTGVERRSLGGGEPART